MGYPDLNLLFALDVLLQEGSVVGAARRMNVSSPSMSRTLSRIRDTLGDPVLVQAGRKLVPTPRALAMREEVKVAIEHATQVLAPSAEANLRTMERRFNVRATDEFVSIYLGRLLKAMALDMPRAILRLAPEEDDLDDEAMRSGRIDLFISASRKLGPEIRAQSLFTTSFVGVAREHHPIFDDHITVERFTQWEHIGVSRRGKAAGPIDSMLEARGLRRRFTSVVSSPYAALFSLQDSDLLLSLPKHLAGSALDAGLHIRLFDLPFPVETVGLIQAWHPRLHNDPAHQWLRRTIRRMCS